MPKDAVPTNMRILKPSRKKLHAGDVFVVQMPDDQYVYGRVINTAVHGLSAGGAILIYFFRTRSKDKEMPSRDVVRVDNLLIPPIKINRLPWSRGYFETLGNLAFEPGEVLEQHCFISQIFNRIRYYDEFRNLLPGPVEPVAIEGLSSFRTVDDELSDALGFARVPEDL